MAAIVNKPAICFLPNSVYRKYQVLLALALLVTFSVKGQAISINAVNSNLSNDDRAYFKQIAAFEARFFNTVFDTQKNDSCKVNIDLYGKQKEYNAIQQRAMNTTFIDGFYMPGSNKISVYKSDRFMSIMIHETSHSILENNYRDPPKWLNEGIATLFGNLVIQKGEVFYTPNVPYINLVKDMIYDGKFNLKEFFNYNPNDFADQLKRPYVYGMSYCIIYFFVNFDVDQLQHVLVLMQQGYSTMNAFDKVFGGFDKFEKRFRDFYKPEVGYHAHLYKFN